MAHTAMSHNDRASLCKLHEYLTTCKACNNESTTKLSEFTVGCLVLPVRFEIISHFVNRELTSSFVSQTITIISGGLPL